ERAGAARRPGGHRDDAEGVRRSRAAGFGTGCGRGVSYRRLIALLMFCCWIPWTTSLLVSGRRISASLNPRAIASLGVYGNAPFVASSASRATVAGSITGRTMWRLRVISVWRSVDPVDPVGAFCAAAGTTGTSRARNNAAASILDVIRASRCGQGYTFSGHAQVVIRVRTIVGAARKMPAQDSADLGHGLDQGLPSAAFAQSGHHRVAHADPVLVADAGVNRVVADDGELALLH